MRSPSIGRDKVNSRILTALSTLYMGQKRFDQAYLWGKVSESFQESPEVSATRLGIYHAIGKEEQETLDDQAATIVDALPGRGATAHHESDPDRGPGVGPSFDIRLVHGQIRGEDRVLERATVRAVVMRGDRLLLVHSRVNGDLMFPGGGIEHGRRTMRPWPGSCGKRWRRAGGRGPCWERDPGDRAAREPGLRCLLHPIVPLPLPGREDWSAPRPQPYEIRLGFTPGWFPWPRPCKPTRPSWRVPVPSGRRERPGCWQSCTAGKRPAC